MQQTLDQDRELNDKNLTFIVLKLKIWSLRERFVNRQAFCTSKSCHLTPKQSKVECIWVVVIIKLEQTRCSFVWYPLES